MDNHRPRSELLNFIYLNTTLKDLLVYVDEKIRLFISELSDIFQTLQTYRRESGDFLRGHSDWFSGRRRVGA